MATRTVIVGSSLGKGKKFSNVTAETWGEFKSQLGDLYAEGLEAILNPGNVTLTRNDAVLPEEDFKIYLIPTKNKAGAISSEQATKIGSEIAKAIIEATGKLENEEVNNLLESLRETIGDFFGVEMDVHCFECDDAVNEARRLASN